MKADRPQRSALLLGISFCISMCSAIVFNTNIACAAANLKIEPAYYDFGEVPEGPPASMTAVLENRGDTDVTIKNVRTHCACTTSELGKQTLKPREKTTLKIIYNTTDRPGIFKKNITIETDIAGQEEVEMEVVGTVKEAPGAKIQVTPRKIDLGSIKKDIHQKLTLAVHNDGNLPLVIQKIGEKGGGAVYFDGAKQGNFMVEAGKTRQLEIEFTVGKLGSFTEVVVIECNAKNAPKGGFALMVVGKGEN